jgi:outer membrane protein OmpA-like peptidoglycan-associated protein/tetratricopeptide (TPR) repeat protein
MRKSLVFILILMFSGIQITQAQNQLSSKSKKAIKLYEAGMKNYGLRYYDLAVEDITSALAEDSKFIEAWLSLAEVYMDMRKFSESIDAYNKSISINPDFFPGAYLNLAELEFIDGKYDEAKSHYSKYLSYSGISEKSRRSALAGISNCDFAIWSVGHPVPFNPINMGNAVNNELDQYWPSITVDEQTFVFTLLVPKGQNNEDKQDGRPNSIQMQEDFYISTYGEEGWTLAQNAGMPLNSPDNEGAQTLSADGKEMYFTACNRKSGLGLCDIYYSYWNGKAWVSPKNLGAPVNSRYKETQPSLSPDGRTLYFASNRPGGKGGLDLWQSSLQEDGTWSKPVNMGDSINTSGEEQSPFIHSDNESLYFSSTGWPGMGRFDLFLSRKKDNGEWSRPKNLGYPINTNFNEEGLIVNSKGNTAYYSSTREGGFGGRDIYQFEIPLEIRPKPVSYMKGIVYDIETKKPLEAKFELIDLKTARIVMQSYSNQDGTFLISIPAGLDYALNANTPGYLFFSENFTMAHADFAKPYLMDVPLSPIKQGEKSILRNIFFDTDKYTLKPESKVELERLVKLLKDNGTVKVQISGHTDNSGTPDHNRVLSENRAKAVVSYLVENGIDIKRLVAKGYGEIHPIASNDTEEGKAQNRRTEFMITEK